MSLKSANKLSSNSAELEIFIDKERFDKACLEAYRKNVGKVNVPGFRKGKAPKAIIEKMYGKGFFYDEALNALIPEFYGEALEESKFEAVGAPKFDVESIDDEGVVLKVNFAIKPDVEVGDYKGIKADRIVKPVSEDDVNDEINRVRERNAREIDVTDRAAANGDTAVIDYEGFADGKAFEGGKGEKHPLTLGSNQFIPGFEDQVVGHNVGDEFDVNVTFPEQYHAPELAGKPAVFKVKIHEIKSKELPALDDDFAVDVSDFNTFAEYKASVESTLKENNEKTAERGIEEQLIDALVDGLKADVPQEMYDTEIDEQIREFDMRLSSQGLNVDMYMKYTGLDASTLRSQFQAGAERQVKARLALEKIADLEKLEVSDDDMKAEYEKIASSYGIDVDTVKASVSDDMLRTDIKMRKAVEFVKANAAITEKTEEEAAKEAAAKAEKAAADAKAETEKAAKPKKTTAKKTTTKAADAEDAPKAEKTEKTEKATKTTSKTTKTATKSTTAKTTKTAKADKTEENK